MMRPIDADALVKDGYVLHRTYQQDKKTMVYETKRIEDVPTVQIEPKWIPCSERLPDEKDAGILKKLGIEKRSEDVLATVEVKGERMTVTTCTYDGKWEWDMKYAFPDYKVIAWMPLPEPYQGERRKE